MSQSFRYDLGILGAGNMAEAIARGVTSRGVLRADQILAADVAESRREFFTRQLGIRAFCTNRHLPIQMAKGVGRTDFSTDLSGPISAIRIIQGPTIPRASARLM